MVNSHTRQVRPASVRRDLSRQGKYFRLFLMRLSWRCGRVSSLQIADGYLQRTISPCCGVRHPGQPIPKNKNVDFINLVSIKTQSPSKYFRLNFRQIIYQVHQINHRTKDYKTWKFCNVSSKHFYNYSIQYIILIL